MLATVALQLTLLVVAPMARFLGVTALSAIDLAACAGVSLACVAYLELEKGLAQVLRHAGHSPHPRTGA